jgi:hypothetical protein
VGEIIDNGLIDHIIMGAAATVMDQTFGRYSFLRGVGILGDKSLIRMRKVCAAVDHQYESNVGKLLRKKLEGWARKSELNLNVSS